MSSIQFDERLKQYGVKPYSKHYKLFSKANLLENIDYDYIDEIQSYWIKHYKKKINPLVHIAYHNLLGKKDVRIMPTSVMWNEIIPFFNDMFIRPGYSDKNLYDRLVDTENRPETVLKRVHGNYFDSNNTDINREQAEKILIAMQQDLIIKPSNADNGRGVGKIYHRQGKLYYNNKHVSIIDLEKELGHNFIVQKVIQQHPMMAEPHPASVNTLRMVTFRWKGKIQHLLTYARFGGGNNVKDHAIHGGVSVSVDDDGVLGDYGLDTYLRVHTHHPTTNFSFKDNKIQIPNYKYFIEFVENLHKNILHHDFVSWDIAVGIDGQPVFIEPNFRGTSWRYQLASKKPIFGDLTEEVLEYVSDQLNNDGYFRSGEYDIKKLIKANEKLKKRLESRDQELKRKNKEIKELNKEINSYKVELNNIKSSKSWKITKPLRQISRKF